MRLSEKITKRAIIRQHIAERRHHKNHYGEYMPYNPSLAAQNTRNLRELIKTRNKAA